jgi:hypothetical protein
MDPLRFIFSAFLFFGIIANIHMLQGIPVWKTSRTIIALTSQRIIT